MKRPLLRSMAFLALAFGPMAHAITYNVSARFTDGGLHGETLFTGSFDWNGSTVTNFQGYLSEDMWGWNAALGHFDANGTAAGGLSANGYESLVWNKPGGYLNNEAPLLLLTHQLASSVSGNLVTVTAFLQNSSNVVSYSGYDVKTANGNFAYGTNGDGNVRNYNAFFTLVFDKTNPTNTSATWPKIIYGDFTSLGLMGSLLTGDMGMTGFDSVAGGTMGGKPTALSINAPVSVPMPASATWLLGTALMGLISVIRRKAGTSSYEEIAGC